MHVIRASHAAAPRRCTCGWMDGHGARLYASPFGRPPCRESLAPPLHQGLYCTVLQALYKTLAGIFELFVLQYVGLSLVLKPISHSKVFPYVVRRLLCGPGLLLCGPGLVAAQAHHSPAHRPWPCMHVLSSATGSSVLPMHGHGHGCSGMT